MSQDMLTLATTDVSTGSSEEFVPLEEGLYNAVCIGITVKEMQNFDKTGVEDKIEFLFQIVENGQAHYVRSKPCKKSLHEKSGLWKILASWTKQKDAATLIEKMGTDGKFNLRYFIGKPIQLTVKLKEVGDKTYPYVSDYMAPKKGQSVSFKAEAIPAYLVKDVKSKDLIEGITVKVVSPKVVVPVQESSTLCEEPHIEDTCADSDLPFN